MRLIGQERAGRQSRRSNCRLGAEADSEIPELGLDSGRLSIDCDVNPLRVADVAYRAARRYKQHRGAPSTVVKRKRTQISFDRAVERSNGREPERPLAEARAPVDEGANGDEGEEEEDDD